MEIETLLILAAVAVLALLAGAGLALALPRGGGREAAALEEKLAQLQGRLDQFASSASQGQEGLRKALEERLDAVTKRVGDSLGESTKTTAETLQNLNERLALIGEAQRTIADLSGEVVGLKQILSNKQARGAFGEVQLRELIEDLLPPDAYTFNTALSNGRQPDAFIRLSGPPGDIAIDAKFPLESWRALAEAPDEAAKITAGRAFSADVKKHIKDISERYVIPGETADSALMFVPSEAVYAAIHADFADIVDYGRQRRVHIVSPTTVMALLTAIRAVLRDARMHEQAGLIQKAVGEMMKDVERLDDRIGRLKTHFRQANEDIDQIEISTRKITSKGEKIAEVRLEDPAEDRKMLPEG